MSVVESPSGLTIEDVARYPYPGSVFPVSLQFGPDSQKIAYLFSPEGSLKRQLFYYDLVTGEKAPLVLEPDDGLTEENISLEEKLRRERMRQRGLGITSYQWNHESGRILVPLPGGLYISQGAGQVLEQILSNEDGPILDPRFSPDGEWVAYVQNDDLHVVAAAGGRPRQLTHGAFEKGVTRGLAEFVAQEEMRRQHGYWWSRDSKSIAFTEVDENHIPIYRIMHQGKDTVGEGAQEDHRYPFAGAENAHVGLAVVSVEGGEPVWMAHDPTSDTYIARVTWSADGRLLAQIQNRAQTELNMMAFDPVTGEASLLWQEKNEIWINLHEMFRPLKKVREADQGAFIWASERSGFQHLYLFDVNGRLVRPLTEGEWLVESLAGVDEEKGLVYFTANQAHPLERHLYVVSLDGGQPRQISQAAGIHTVVLDAAREKYVDTQTSLNEPPNVTIRSLGDNSLLGTIFDEVDPRLDKLDLAPPEMVDLSSRDGERLYGAVYRPPAEFGAGPFPTLVYVYGGPHVQLNNNSWGPTVNLRAHYLSRQGFLIFVLDNRGSARRGLEFEGAIKDRPGNLEVQDQVDGVRWLVAQGLADPERVAIYGWSYGGYMALMCLARAADTFKLAVAGAPVTNYDGYDTHYTERYFGKPQDNPEGYQDGSVMAHVDKIKGKMLLIHGLLDENVHFRHTARLIKALIKAGRRYDLLLLPDERHGPRSLADRVYLEAWIRDFLLENL